MSNGNRSTENNVIIHDTQVDTHRRPPMFFFLFLCIVILGCVMIALATWQSVHTNTVEQERDCKRAIAVRVDNRAMWLYLLESAPDTPKTEKFVIQLNKKLPVLKCDEHWNPVPLKERKS
jgi:hypothetical protein